MIFVRLAAVTFLIAGPELARSVSTDEDVIDKTLSALDSKLSDLGTEARDEVSQEGCPLVDGGQGNIHEVHRDGRCQSGNAGASCGGSWDCNLLPGMTQRVCRDGKGRSGTFIRTRHHDFSRGISSNLAASHAGAVCTMLRM